MKGKTIKYLVLESETLEIYKCGGSYKKAIKQGKFCRFD